MNHLDDQGFANHCLTCARCAAAQTAELTATELTATELTAQTAERTLTESTLPCARGAELRARRNRTRERIRVDAQLTAVLVLGYVLAGNAP